MTIKIRIWRLAFDVKLRLLSRRSPRRIVTTLKGHTWDTRKMGNEGGETS